MESQKTRGSFAENSAKPVRATGSAWSHPSRPLPTVALGRQTHYTMTTAHLELAMRRVPPLVPNHRQSQGRQVAASPRSLSWLPACQL